MYVKRLLFENNVISELKSDKIIEMEKQLEGSKLCKKSVGTQPKFKELPYFLMSLKHLG